MKICHESIFLLKHPRFEIKTYIFEKRTKHLWCLKTVKILEVYKIHMKHSAINFLNKIVFLNELYCNTYLTTVNIHLSVAQF